MLGLEVSRKLLLDARASSGIVSLFPHLFSHWVIFSQSMKKVVREGRRKSHARQQNRMGNDQEICLRQHGTGDRKAYTMEPYRKRWKQRRKEIGESMDTEVKVKYVIF